jgi:hypothetical protein
VGVRDQRHVLDDLPPGMTWYAVYRRMGGPRGQSGTQCTGGWVGPRASLVRNVQEDGWTPGPVWTGAENLAFLGIRSPDRRAKDYYFLVQNIKREHKWE